MMNVAIADVINMSMLCQTALVKIICHYYEILFSKGKELRVNSLKEAKKKQL